MIPSPTKIKIKKLQPVLPYLLLLYLCIWQAFALLKVEDQYWLQVLAAGSSFVFYCLLIQISEKVFKALLVCSLLLAFFIYPALKVYGYPDKNMISSILYTNTEEAWSYIHVVPFKYFFQLILLTLYTTVLLLLHYRKFKKPLITYGMAAYLLIAPVIYLFGPGQPDFEGPDQLRPTVRYTHIPIVKTPLLLAIEAYQVIKKNDHIMEEAAMPDKWEVLNAGNLPLINNFVVIIGESVRKDFMHCYGFPLPNTPFIDHSPHIQFNHFISAGAYTVPTLERTLVLSQHFPNYKLCNNLVNLAKKAGYETYWVSNQGYIGIFDSPVSIIAETSDHYIKLNGGDFHTAKMDKDMLPIIARIIKNNQRPKVIFVHMIGSHPEVCDRTKGRHDHFVLSGEISCYVQSIKNTDSFLSVIYQDLKQTRRPFGLVYFSDHGLKINEDLKLVHGDGIKEAHEVPLLIWSSTIDSSRYISAWRNGKSFPRLFCELTQIKTANISSPYPFLSDVKPDSSVFKVVISGSKVLDYNKFKRNPIPPFKAETKEK